MVLSNSGLVAPSAMEGQHDKEDDASNEGIEPKPHCAQRKTLLM
jgi:hypothetical protein